MTDESLLLRLRAETLQANLTRLRDHLAIPDRMQDLQRLAATAEEALKSIRTTERARATLRDKIDRKEPIGWKEKIDLDETSPEAKTVDNTFDDMQHDLNKARTNLLTLQDTIGQMTAKCFRVTQISVGKDIIDGLRTRTQPLIAEFGNIRTLGNNPKDLASGWETLRKKTALTEPILTDYMELLGGAALRDTGFDEKISYFADELLRSTGGKLLALPMRRQELVTTIKQIIRVTFPDWTVWALPSAALEFWNVVGGQRVEETLEAYLGNLPAQERILIQPLHKMCLGDAYATYTMGPAYAYYAVGLVLAVDSEEDHYRVRAILAMLEQMEESPVGTLYLDVRRQLLGAWNAARVQFGRPLLDLNVGNPANANNSDPDGRGVRVLISGFWKTLELETSAKFGAAIWTESQPWAKLLLEDKADQINVPNGAELRHLLNAAWLARTDPQRNLKLDLNAAVKTLQNKLKERQEAKGK